MTLDDTRTWRQAAADDRAHDLEQERLEWLDREATESVEAMEAHWAGVFAARPEWMTRIHYDHGWLDPAQRGPHD